MGCKSRRLLAIGIDLSLHCHQSRNLPTWWCPGQNVFLSYVRTRRTSVMHDVPRHLLHQILECDLCKLGWKNILDQVRVTFSDSVTHTQY